MGFDYDRYHEPAADDGWTPERSERWSRLNSAVKAEHVRELFQRAHLATEKLSLLDVGCGDGQVLARLAEHGFGPELVGVEVSGAGARLAQRHAEVSRVLTFDGERLPFPDSSFDAVLATHVLEHVANPLGLLNEMRRVAESFVVIEVPLEDNISARRPKAVERSRGVGHIQRFSKADARRLISDAGLTSVANLTDPLSRELRVLLDGPARGTVKWTVRSALAMLPLGERLMTVHYAVLARKN